MTPRQRSLYLLLPAAALIAMLTVACTGAGEGYAKGTALPAEETAQRSPGASPTTIAMQPPAPATPGSPLTVRPLSELSSAAAAYSEAFPGCCLGIAVAVPSEGVIYTHNGDMEFVMASVAKVPLMLTLLAQAEDEGRDLTHEEETLLASMITLSDNDAADAVYEIVGGANGVSEMLAAAGLDGAYVDPEAWGTSTITAPGAALLIARLLEGEIIGEPYRGIALDLMASVVSYQAWGATAGTGEAATTGLKNGWFPEKAGWRLNSLAYVMPDGAAPYTIAVFTFGAANYFRGIAEIELLAARINSDAPSLVAAR